MEKLNDEEDGMSERMKILFAYDGSTLMNDLLRAGLPREAEAVLISVMELWLPGPEGADFSKQVLLNVEKTALDAARSSILEASEKFKESFPGWEIRTEVRLGSPAEEILGVADEWKPNLIVVAPHSRSTISRLILGSVSQRIINEAHCSVHTAREQPHRANKPVRIIIGTD